MYTAKCCLSKKVTFHNANWRIENKNLKKNNKKENRIQKNCLKDGKRYSFNSEDFQMDIFLEGFHFANYYFGHSVSCGFCVSKSKVINSWRINEQTDFILGSCNTIHQRDHIQTILNGKMRSPAWVGTKQKT